MMKPIPERQNPRSATTEGSEGKGKVGISNQANNIVHYRTLSCNLGAVIHHSYNVARHGYTNGSGHLRRRATAVNSRKPMGRASSGLGSNFDPQTLVKLAINIGAPSEVYKLTAISAHCVSAAVKRFNGSVFGYIGQLLL